jgi:hypothetical protein
LLCYDGGAVLLLQLIGGGVLVPRFCGVRLFFYE